MNGGILGFWRYGASSIYFEDMIKNPENYSEDEIKRMKDDRISYIRYDIMALASKKLSCDEKDIILLIDKKISDLFDEEMKICEDIDTALKKRNKMVIHI